MGADPDRRLEYPGIQASDHLILPLRVGVEERLLLRDLAQHGLEIAAFRLVFAGVRLVLLADPAERFGGRCDCCVRLRLRIPSDNAPVQSILEAMALLKPDAPQVAINHSTLPIKRRAAKAHPSSCRDITP